MQPNMAKENFSPCSCDLTGLVSVQECGMRIQAQMPKEMAFLTLALLHEFAHLIFFFVLPLVFVLRMNYPSKQN